MNHHSKKRKFGLEANERDALIRSLARALVLHNRITTTTAKAKELRPFVEKLVTKAKAGTLADRRLIITRIGGEKEAKILVETIAPKYKDRKGGYIRIAKLPARKLDAAAMAVIEFV
jgi:large subunit ribosomal protein L17